MKNSEHASSEDIVGSTPEAEQGLPRANTQARFSSTQWSLILAAKKGDELAGDALEQLCQTYWTPVYAFVRRKGNSPDDAKDLAQGFFMHLLKRDWLNNVEPREGRLFRSFLLRCLSNYLINEWKRTKPEKLTSLDAGFEPSTDPAPVKEYDREWVRTLVDRVRKELRAELEAANKAELFDELSGFIGSGVPSGTYTGLAQKLNTTESNLRVIFVRLRKRFGELLWNNVAQTVSDPAEVQDELRYLLTAWGQSE